MKVEWIEGLPEKQGIYWVCYSNEGFDQIITIGKITNNQILLFGQTRYKYMDELNITHHCEAIYPQSPN